MEAAEVGGPDGPWLAYDVVDVFTDRAYTGNPLAVVHGAVGLRAEQLQAVARELHLSEATFPAPHGDDGAAYDVRIFTPEEEIPFAGHPTLGTAWLLRRQGALTADQVVQHCGAGEVPVRVERDGAELTATPRSVVRRPDAHALAASVGLGAGDVDGPAYDASCGLAWTFLRVHLDAVGRSRVPGTDLPATATGPTVGTCVHALVDGGDGHALRVRARVFCPGAGVPEDPATGSAAAALGLVLVASGQARPDGLTAYTVRQGIELRRPSLLHGRVQATGGEAVAVRVAGGVAHVATGRLRVPALPG